MPLVRVADVDLYYELHGPEGAPVVAFVNGIFQDTTGWTLHVRRLRDRFRCLVWDCRGQGRSAKPPGPYATTRHAADLGALLDTLAVARAHVVGSSNGAAVAMHFAASHPDRVAALVLAAPFARADAALRAKLASWRAALDAGGPALRYDVAVPWNWSARFLAEHAADVAALREVAAALDPDAQRSLLDGSMAHDVAAALSRITAPTLVLVGEHDLLTPPWMARAVAAGIAGARLEVLSETGHALAIERVDDFCALVATFVGAPHS